LKARPTITKRLRERAKEDKKRVKAARRDERREGDAEKTDAPDDGEDPDIAGIVPGPQALDPELFGKDYHQKD
jgi:hypothetical protein